MNLTPLFLPLEKASLLDPVSDTVATKLRSALDGSPVDGLLRGTFVGHPMHPILAYSAVGTWSSAVLLDLTGGNAEAARLLIGAGLIAAPTAIATGWATWSTLTREQRRVGLIHAGSNAVAAGLFAASYRRRSKAVNSTPDKTAKALALAGFTVAGVAGALGGHLGFNMGGGVAARAVAAGV
ncbi:hypothetical protein DK926_20845 [Rhodococcus sp. Eu-32]|uniref:DUF2231 domain-containing protein n=1 Tax=Rhodococcus sp. Eu-32 TaxID=1017319 RepID=UPI000DF1F346|nr:DUF2231 domain-containing protein [Rhodococcus sp. Eu-32]RRQ25843.1 hypothetical protein DK926_20845 [Rhodococcus sp. Eu-32]